MVLMKKVEVNAKHCVEEERLDALLGENLKLVCHEDSKIPKLTANNENNSPVISMKGKL